MAKYEGDELEILEWPCGCEIITHDKSSAIIVRSPKDAKAIIESLGRYLDTFKSTEPSNNVINSIN